jgi:hypothetical protein
VVEEDGKMFGIPDKEDPDPYGVLALEKEGLSLKEAGTNKRASWQEFNFNPSPTSPVHAVYQRNSQEKDRRGSSSATQRSSWRASAFSNTEPRTPKTPSSLRNSMDQFPGSRPRSTMVDTATQTDLPDAPPSPGRWSAQSGRSRTSSRGSNFHLPNGHHMERVPENQPLDTSPDRKEPESASNVNGYSTPPRTPPTDEGAAEDEQGEDAQIEEPVVHEIQSVQAMQPTSPQMISKARIVNVPKRVPPKLPPRNPNRNGPLVIDSSPKLADEEVGTTPVESKEEEEKPALSTRTSLEEKQEKPVQPLLEEADGLEKKMDEVKLDDEEEEEEEGEVPMSNPWAKAEEARNKTTRESLDSSKMPGGFE